MQETDRQIGKAKPDGDAGNAAEDRQRHRLDQELHQHLSFQCADRQPCADLASALGDRDQHDVHDADAADQQADRGDRAEQAGQQRRCAGHRLGDLRHVVDVEIVLAALGDLAPLAQQPLDIALYLGGGKAVARRHHDRRNIRRAADAALEGFQRHQDRVVLIAAHAGLPLFLQHADDRAGELADADDLVFGGSGAEQLAAHGLAEDAGRLAAALFRGQEGAAARQIPALRHQIIAGDAGDAGRMVLAAGNRHRRRLVDRRHRPQAADLRADRLDIAFIEAFRLGGAAARAELAGAREQHVGAETGKISRHLRRRAVADGDHGDDRRDADDDAEHGEEGAQRIAADGAQRQAHGFKKHRPAPGSVRRLPDDRRRNAGCVSHKRRYPARG